MCHVGDEQLKLGKYTIDNVRMTNLTNGCALPPPAPPPPPIPKPCCLPPELDDDDDPFKGN